MASSAKHAQKFARRLFQLSLADGAVSAERVTGVLAYIEKHRPASPVMVLRAYHRLIAAELARGQAVIEHAGSVSDASLQAIAVAMTKKYARTVTAVPRPDPALLAGLRVRVGDDVYESSIAGRLEPLTAG